MAERELSSDLDLSDGQSIIEPASPKRSAKSRSRPARAASAPPASSSRDNSTSLFPSKEERRRHHALECQFRIAQQKALNVEAGSPPAVAEPASAVQPPLDSGSQSTSVNPVAPSGTAGALSVTVHAEPDHHRSSRRVAPSATYTPTAAGLRHGEETHSDQSLDVQSIVAATISRLMASGTWSPAVAPSIQPPSQPPVASTSARYPDYDCYQDSIHSDDSNWDDEDRRESEFSEDEGLLPDRPRLFRPALFKSLLHKAKASTNLADPPDQQAASASALPSDGLFNVQATAQDFIPCPQLFSEVIQRPWALPSSLPAPNGLDKKLYCSAPNLQEMLQLPSVDAPVAQLTASSVLTNDVADGL